MQISKIVEEQISEANNVFKGRDVIEVSLDRKQFIDKLVSSHLAALEAELDRKRGMMEESIKKPMVKYYGNGKCDEDIRYNDGYKEAIQEDITYLEQEIEKCKKL
jgi:hypothetical protein